MCEKYVNVSTGRKTSSVASTNGGDVLVVQVLQLFIQQFFDLYNFCAWNSFLKVLEMLQTNLLGLRQFVLMFF